jgi:hypothetical protein
VEVEKMTIRAGRTDVGGPPVRDDLVLPFGTVRSRVAGRVVRLGHVIDEILSAHDYPEPISVILGQAIALTALLGQQLQEGGRLILQTKTDGPLGSSSCSMRCRVGCVATRAMTASAWRRCRRRDL